VGTNRGLSQFHSSSYCLVEVRQATSPAAGDSTALWYHVPPYASSSVTWSPATKYGTGCSPTTLGRKGAPGSGRLDLAAGGARQTRILTAAPAKPAVGSVFTNGPRPTDRLKTVLPAGGSGELHPPTCWRGSITLFSRSSGIPDFSRATSRIVRPVAKASFTSAAASS